MSDYVLPDGYTIEVCSVNPELDAYVRRVNEAYCNVVEALLQEIDQEIGFTELPHSEIEVLINPLRDKRTYCVGGLSMLQIAMVITPEKAILTCITGIEEREP